MAFLTLGIEKNCLQQRKSYLEYEESKIVSQLNDTQTEMVKYLNNSSDAKVSDKTYAKLEAKGKIYDTKKTQIEQQLSIINSEMESYEKAVQNNIKNDCKFSISV